MNRFLAVALFCVAALFGSAAQPLFAQSVSPEMDDDVRGVAKQLNCPTCSGRNLADCPTETCLQWKGEIRSQLDAGKSSQEVVQYFQDRFGATVLQEPPKAGSTLILWLVPIGGALMLIGGGIVAVQRRSVRIAPAHAAPTTAAPSDPYARRIEEEVQDGL